MTNPLHKAAAAALALALSLSLAACGSDSAQSAQSSQSASSESGSSVPEVDRTGKANFPKVAGGFGEDPEISAGSGDAPTQVSVKTLAEGSGAALTTSDTVLVNYELVLWDGTKVESSFESGSPIAFSLGQVIPGWTYGLEGQKVGDRVEIVIPPKWGYGDTATGSIPAGSTLVFVVDVLDSTSNVAIDENALTQGTATGNALPDGVTVTGDPGVEPTLSFADGATAPTANSQTTIVSGTGQTVGESDYVLYRGVGAPFGQATSASSSWAGKPLAVSAKQLGLAGAKVGDRIVFVVGAASAAQSGSTSTSTTPTVIVMDIVGVMKTE
ncbi:FKBP-type peptidyl-prolyl cis-trans isomerase [Actinomyces culturomici]|uniref:FKBP-type peptidyl-prolyl cis-trans isomerase n=1 Tax=Actinomyces culturomici TaxID=1926276 RepID=UPI000E2042E1|nr:FKBP-type peptidyl-prolyl cis-trans isomerase [Actinomyces culturomici]